MKARTFLFCMIMLISLLLSGCWSSHEVNTLGLTVCIGIDKCEDGYIISEQIINPKAIASKKATNEAPVTIYSSEGRDIQETIARLTTLSSRKIYSSHLRMVIISEEVAKDGIVDIVDYLLRFHEYRTDFFFAIAKGTSAKDILSILTPIEAIPGVDMFNKLKMSYEEWAPTKAIRIVELTNDILADGINPVINAIEIVDNVEKTDSTDVLKKSGAYEKLRFTDLGAFNSDKLVGWLTEPEAKGYNYILGTVKRTSGFALENNVELSYDVQKTKSKIKASVDNNQPKIDVTIEVTCVIVGVQGELDVTKLENTEIVNQMAERTLTNMCQMAVQKAQKELKTDIFGFGERIHAKDPKYWKTVKDNWNEVFTTLPVNIKVTVKTIATGDISKPLSLKS